MLCSCVGFKWNFFVRMIIADAGMNQSFPYDWWTYGGRDKRPMLWSCVTAFKVLVVDAMKWNKRNVPPYFGIYWFIAHILNFLSLIYLNHHYLWPLDKQ